MPAAAPVAPGSPCPNTGRSQGLGCIVGTDDSSLPGLMLHRHPQLATQCPEPAATHSSEQASLSTDHGGPTLTSKSSCGRTPTAPSKSRKQALHSVVICHSVGARRPVSLRHKKAQYFPLFLTIGDPPTSPLKTKNARFLTEGRKAVTYYSLSGIRRPNSQNSQRPSAPHCP
jgi:hypothetical protein